MIDYYLGFQSMDGMTEWGKWNKKIRDLAIGGSFVVSTGSERDNVLQTAHRIGVTVRTKKLSSGGFCVERIDACAPRKRGRQKKEQL